MSLYFLGLWVFSSRHTPINKPSAYRRWAYTHEDCECSVHVTRPSTSLQLIGDEPILLRTVSYSVHVTRPSTSLQSIGDEPILLRTVSVQFTSRAHQQAFSLQAMSLYSWELWVFSSGHGRVVLPRRHAPRKESHVMVQAGQNYNGNDIYRVHYFKIINNGN